MEKLVFMKAKTILKYLGIGLLSTVVVLLIVEYVLSVLIKYNELLFKIFEIIIALASSVTLSVSISLNYSNKENKTSVLNSDIDGRLNSINADGNIVNININNDSEVKNELVTLTRRMDDIEKNNVETIVNLVIERLKDKKVKNVDQDFIMKFVSESKTISSKEMQEIWAMLMVNNAISDELVSKRTLDIVKNLTKDEATIFELLSSLAFSDGTIYKPFTKDIPFIHITIMQDVGLVKQSETLTYKYTIEPNGNSLYVEGNRVFKIKNLNNTVNKNASYPCYVLTNEGCELKHALNIAISNEKIKEFVLEMRKKAFSGIEVSLHKLVALHSDGQVTYETEDISTIK